VFSCFDLPCTSCGWVSFKNIFIQSFSSVKEFILILRCTTAVIGFGHWVSSSPGFRLIFRVFIQIGGLDFC
jgi:hypothetical protein